MKPTHLEKEKIMRQVRLASVLIVIALVGALAFVAGCKKQAPLGTEENPIVWSFVPSSDTQQISAGGKAVADMLSGKPGRGVIVMNEPSHG